MTFVDRGYPDVVQDVLTTLTAGVAGETHPVALNADGTVADVHLVRRPVARVSRVAGYVEVAPDADPVRAVFGLDDYELVTDPADPEDRSTLRFLPTGRTPAAETDLTVNYYPRAAGPSPVRDVSVGSVARTLVEAVAREIAVGYAQLNAAYDSGFVESATGASLDRVVALLGHRRYAAGRPVGTVRFSRRAGATGEVTIPAGTPVADARDTVRYETTETRTMLAGESTAEVRVRGALAGTPVVDAGVLTVVQRAIAGIDVVVNEAPTATAAQEETDVELRARVTVALASAATGTVGALRNGLLALPAVRAVNVEERPDGVPGEVRVSVSLAEPPADGGIPAEVVARVEELRPAGIHVRLVTAAELALAARVRLVLAGGSMPAAERDRLHEQARATLVDRVTRTQVGQRLRTGALQAALIDGERVLDASIAFGPRGADPGAPGADVVPDPQQAVRLTAADVSFDEDAFDAPAPAPAVPVDVALAVRLAAPVADGDAVRAALTGRLTAYLGTLAPGGTVTGQTLLDALRDDAAFALDPQTLVGTFTAGDAFVQVSLGGGTFAVTAGQRLVAGTVAVTA